MLLTHTHGLFSEALAPGAGGAAPPAAPTVAIAPPTPPAAAERPAPPAASDMQGATVPYPRFSEVVSERNGYRARQEELVQTVTSRDSRIAELEAELAGHKEREVSWGQERTEFETALQGMQSEFSERWQLSQELGIQDPDVIDYARRKFQQLPDEGRPESLVEAFKSWGSDPDSCPALLRPHLPRQAPKASEALQTAHSMKRGGAPRMTWPDPKRNSPPPPAPTPPAQQEWTQEQYREAKARGWTASQIMRARMGQG